MLGFKRSLHFQESISPEKIRIANNDGILKITAPLREPKKQQNVKIEIEQPRELIWSAQGGLHARLL